MIDGIPLWFIVLVILLFVGITRVVKDDDRE